MAESIRNDDVLSSKDAIKAYMEWTDYMFETFKIFHFPARQINGRWYASKALLDKWWIAFCNADSSQFDDNGTKEDTLKTPVKKNDTQIRPK